MEDDTALDAAPSARACASGVTHVREIHREHSTHQESSTRRVGRRVGGWVGGWVRACVGVLCMHTHGVSTARMQSPGHVSRDVHSRLAGWVVGWLGGWVGGWGQNELSVALYGARRQPARLLQRHS
jgi:hypothetical protein